MNFKFSVKSANIFRSISFLVIVLSNLCIAQNKTPWSVRMAESEMKRHSIYSYYWDYVTGTFLKGIEELWRTTNDTRYFQYIQNNLDAGFNGKTGLMSGYDMSIYSLDAICEGRMLLLMKKEGKMTTRYQNAIDTLRKQLRNQPRVAEGGFWHRNNTTSNAYPHQMWLDGIYMANPFYAEYGKLFNEPADYNDVITQITVMEKHARDTVTGLLYHGWDESKTQAWANPITGCSQSFWGRAVGWYAMALVDVLDYLPSDYSGRQTVIAVLQRLAEAIKKVQDPTYGTWYQVLDQGSKSDNYREASASCDFVYTLAKAANKGYIDQSYWEVVKKGYDGILNEFITINSDSTINIIKTCTTAGLGQSGSLYRDGSYNYYVNQTTQSTNDGKATGPFILASLELEKTGFIVPPLNVTTSISNKGLITITWTDKSYNAIFFIVERSSDGNTFAEVGSVNKGITSFVDSKLLTAQTKYYYRVKAIAANSSSDYSNVSSIIATGVNNESVLPKTFQLNWNYPNPFNPSTVISYQLPVGNFVTLKVYDVLGNEIATLVNGYQQAGSYNSQFSITNSQLSSGLYFYKLQAGNFVQTKKMILLK